MMSTVHFDCSLDTRLVIAGGTLANFAAAAVFWLLLRRSSLVSPALHYFLWFSMTINLLTAGGYFLFSGVANIGDWAEFVKGLQPSWAWRIGLTLVGGASYLIFIWIALLALRPLIGSERPGRTRQAVRLTVLPYLAGGVLACIAGLLNPVGVVLVAISAAASTFGGTSGLAWIAQMLDGKLIPPGPPAKPVLIARNLKWIFGSAILVLIFVFVLGPGVYFQPT